jgi:hypothetical protein
LFLLLFFGVHVLFSGLMSTSNINEDLDETFKLDFDPSFGKPKGHLSLKEIEAEERCLFEEEQRAAKKNEPAAVVVEAKVEAPVVLSPVFVHAPVISAAAPVVEGTEIVGEAGEAEENGVATLCDEDKRKLQEVAWQFLSAPASSSAATPSDESHKRFNASPKSAVEAIRANDPSYTIVDLSSNSIFAIKHREYTEQLADALRTNTYVKEVHLAKVDLDAKDAAALGAALEQNDSVEVLDLEKNKINNDGATALANSLKFNKRLVELNLLGQGNQFGDACLEMFIELFDYNVTLTKIIWRLDSRKSFTINKLIVRNNTILKWLQEGKDVSSKIPSKCFVKQLLVLGNNSKPLATLRAEASGLSPSSPKVARHTSGSFSTSSPKVVQHASPAPTVDPADVAVSVSVSRVPEGVTKPDSNVDTAPRTPDQAVKDVHKEAPPAFTINSESSVSTESLPGVSQTLRSSPMGSPSVVRKLRPGFNNSSGNISLNNNNNTSDVESGGEGSPGSSKPERRRSVLGSLRKGDAPSVIIAAIESNDPATTVLNLEKNVSFAMKQQEFCQRLGAALKTNTVCREINLSGCSIDSTGAKFLAEGLAQNKSLRVRKKKKSTIFSFVMF